MNKLEQLIQELCPHGVEYKKLGEVCITITPSYKLLSNEYLEKGSYPIIDQGQKLIVGYTNNKEFLLPLDKYVLFGDHTREIKYCDFLFAQGADGLKILKVIDKIIPKFLFYALQCLSIPNKGYSRYWSIIKNLYIPVPPLDVQKEIVRILDTFTEHEKELEKELEACKKQYEFYREKFLSFDDSVPLVSLSEIALDMYRGSGIKRDEVRKNGTPCVRYGEIYTDYNIWFNKCLSYTDENLIQSKKYFEKNDILFAITGEKVEEISKSCAYIGEEKCLAGGDIVVMKHNQNAKYLSYALSTFSACKQKSFGKVKRKVVHSSIPELKKIKIPLPPLEEQERIVNILDRFDALCNDLTCGLPAEIEARRKQYAYYRDKLLTFKNIAENS